MLGHSHGSTEVILYIYMVQRVHTSCLNGALDLITAIVYQLSQQAY